jgi:hypothetical protein
LAIGKWYIVDNKKKSGTPFLISPKLKLNPYHWLHVKNCSNPDKGMGQFLFLARTIRLQKSQ